MEQEISRLRLYLMRIVFFLTFIGLMWTWKDIFFSEEVLSPLEGVAIAFWASLSALAIIGVLYPVKMLPLLILQFMYKSVWLLGVGLPLWNAGQVDSYTKELIMANGIGVILDIVVIPWVYVFKTYFVKIRT